MTVPTITCCHGVVPGDTFPVADEKARYLLRVRRVETGSTVRVVAADGLIATALVTAVEERSLTLTIQSVTPGADPFEQQFVLLASGLKSGGTSDLVAACAELGVDGLALTNMQRSVARLTPDKLPRLARVADDAARKVAQTNRLQLSVHDNLLTALDAFPEAARFVLDEDASQLLETLELPPHQDILLCVGPEGGFEGHERQFMASAGVTPVRLRGPAYRARTAAMAGIILFLARLDRL
jgi:16S rRNA (uracil1498-N3)-methyltransferase